VYRLLVRLSYFGNDLPFRVKPLIRPRRTSQSRAVHFISAARETPDLNLPTLEFSLADTAHTLIVERIPFSGSISVAQNRQSIVEFDMHSHHEKTLRITSKQTIGTVDDCVIGQNPTRFSA
jgi:hypothetical protein